MIAFKSTDYDLYTLQIAAARWPAGDGASCILDGLRVGIASVNQKKKEKRAEGTEAGGRDGPVGGGG